MVAVTTSYPGVYLTEVPSGVRTISGAATSVAAFVGRTWRGPDGEPMLLTSYADYERQFGGIWRPSSLGYAVRDFFANGGGQAVVVRLKNAATAAGWTPGDSGSDKGGKLSLAAVEPGSWANALEIAV